MKEFDYSTALNQLKLNHKDEINNIRYENMPDWVGGQDFLTLFLPFVVIKTDSREQDQWVADMCAYSGIKCEKAVLNKKEKTENLKEGDITFMVQFGDKVYDYTGIVAYERKGKASEWFGNITHDRKRVEREFARQCEKGYKKFVLMLEFGNCPFDLINYKYSYWGQGGYPITKSCGLVVYNTITSWKNRYSFDLLQVDTQYRNKAIKFQARQKLFWLMLIDCFFFFRNEIRLECIEKKLLEN